MEREFPKRKRTSERRKNSKRENENEKATAEEGKKIRKGSQPGIYLTAV